MSGSPEGCVRPSTPRTRPSLHEGDLLACWPGPSPVPCSPSASSDGTLPRHEHISPTTPSPVPAPAYPRPAASSGTVYARATPSVGRSTHLRRIRARPSSAPSWAVGARASRPCMHCMSASTRSRRARSSLGDVALGSLIDRSHPPAPGQDRLPSSGLKTSSHPTRREHHPADGQIAGRSRQVLFDSSSTLVGLRPRLSHRPSELSGWPAATGGRARAGVHVPDIVFADEPTGQP